MTRPEISVVIPAYNEAESIPRLYSELKEVLKNTNYEIIFIDDGSTDKTLENIKAIAEGDSSVKCISFQRNFGKAAALSEGFRHSSGSLVITMDADLQDDPNDIPGFIEKIKTGCDLVSGWRFSRHDSLMKRLPSIFFNRMTRFFSGVDIHDFNCGFKAYRRIVVENLHVHGELHRYLPALAAEQGFKVGEVKVNHRPRRFGRSKYGITRLFKGFLDLMTVKFLTTFSMRPLHFFAFFGMLCEILGLITGFYLVFLKLNGHPIGNRPILIFTLLALILGMQFFSLGLLGELVVKSRRERTIVKERINIGTG